MTQAVTVAELREALTALSDQNAAVVAWTTRTGEVHPYVVETPEKRILAVSWDHTRGTYVIHMTPSA